MLNVKNKSHSVTAKIVVPATGAVEGVVVAQGGNIAGWSLNELSMSRFSALELNFMVEQTLSPGQRRSFWADPVKLEPHFYFT